MESILKKNHLESIYKLGIEFAFEHISHEKFKSNNTEEKRIFLNGYKEGLAQLNKEQETKASSIPKAI